MVKRGRGPFLPQDMHSMWPEGQGARCVQDGVAGGGRGQQPDHTRAARELPLGAKSKG